MAAWKAKSGTIPRRVHDEIINYNNQCLTMQSLHVCLAQHNTSYTTVECTNKRIEMGDRQSETTESF